MIRIFILFAYFFSFSCFGFVAPSAPQSAPQLALGCPMAFPTNDPRFCPSFQAAATCRCIAQGVPQGMCKDTNVIYDRMIAMFKTVERACNFQHDTTPQECMDDWSCYRKGGVDSKGRLCQSTGAACHA
jgi:hypothetical protein